MKTRSLFIYKLITALIPIILLALFLFQDFLIQTVNQLPPCPFYSYTHLYCPACGNTRSVTALFHGDLFSALRYNITPVLLGVLFLIYYIERITYCFRRPIRLLPRKLSFYLILIILIMLYYGLRNLSQYLTP